MLHVKSRQQAREGAIERVSVIQRQALPGEREADIDDTLLGHSFLLVRADPILAGKDVLRRSAS
jgi:hypothetical protein